MGLCNFFSRGLLDADEKYTSGCSKRHCNPTQRDQKCNTQASSGVHPARCSIRWRPRIPTCGWIWSASSIWREWIRYTEFVSAAALCSSTTSGYLLWSEARIRGTASRYLVWGEAGLWSRTTATGGHLRGQARIRGWLWNWDVQSGSGGSDLCRWKDQRLLWRWAVLLWTSCIVCPTWKWVWTRVLRRRNVWIVSGHNLWES